MFAPRTYFPIFLPNPPLLVGEFIELVKTNQHRIDKILEIAFSGPTATSYTYAAFFSAPSNSYDINKPIVYVLFQVGNISPGYSGRGFHAKKIIEENLFLLDADIERVESQCAPEKPFNDTYTIHNWWDNLLLDFQNRELFD